MRKLLGPAIAAILVATLTATGAQATLFDFTDTLTDNHGGLHSVTGSFDGTLGSDGNLITDITNPTVFVDGSAFPDNGHLFVFSIAADFSAWELNAVASLDGQHNNFTFADNDWYNNDFSTGEGDVYQSILGISANVSDQHNQVFAGGDATRFRAVVAGGSGSVPEPASWALMVAGFGLAGLALRNRRAVIRFA